MDNQHEVFVGIDVAKAKLDVALRPSGLPLLQHRQLLLAAPPSPSATPILDRFHRGFHLALLAV